MKVYSYVMTLVKDQAAAEEITQNTFYKAMTSGSKYAGRAKEFTWLCTIAKNLVADEYRKTSKHAELDGSAASPVDFTKAVENRDTALQIHMVLHDLEEPYKEVFQLRIFGELSFAEIAAVFGKTENWVRVTYHRARLKIQERVDGNDK